jgi:hypothetical protein
VRYDEDWDRFHNINSSIFGLDDAIGALLVLGFMKKVIRKEARTNFGFMAKLDLEPIGSNHDHARCIRYNCDYFSILERFLCGLGDYGRFGIEMLRVRSSSGCPVCGLIPLDLTVTGHATFTCTMTHISECVTLTTLVIAINEHNVFWNDQVELEAFFLQGPTLDSKRIMALQNVLHALPMLRNADIDVSGIPEKHRDHIRREDVVPFLEYAFTGIRCIKLWLTAKLIMQGNILQSLHGFVRLDLPDTSTQRLPSSSKSTID